MVIGLGCGVALKAAGQAAVRPAIGVQHQDDAIGSVQSNRFVDLFHDKLAMELLIG